MDISTIDLHHCDTVADALEGLERELFRYGREKEQIIRIVHGIGTGALAAAVHEALEKNPMVVSWEENNDGGSCIVRI